MNVGELDERVTWLFDNGEVEQTEEGITVDLATWVVEKLLGARSVTRPLLFKVKSWSHGAAQKIEDAGGKVCTRK